MEDVKVSVCIITYNQEKYIRQTLDSVFMQKTNFNFEVIVGEDASPDNTREILLEYKEKYGDQLVLVLHDKNLGVSANAVSVRAKVRGKYTASLEGDDYWIDEYKLQKQYDILENNPRYSAVYHDMMLIDAEGNVVKDKELNLKKDRVKTMKDWLKDGYTLHTCSGFRRHSVFKETDEKYIKLRTAEPTMGDLITFTLLYDAGDIYVMKDVMAAHRKAGKNDTSSFSYKQKSEAIKYTYMFMRIMHNLETYFDNKYDFSARICNRIASVRLKKLVGRIDYDQSQMRNIMKELSVKMRIDVYRRMVKMGIQKVLKRIGLHHG